MVLICRRVADESIDQVDPQRDTGVCGEMFWNGILRCLTTVYTYFVSSYPSIVMFIYLCILCLSTIYVTGFERMLEEMRVSTKITPRISKCIETQKGQWRNNPQGSQRQVRKDSVFHKRMRRNHQRILEWWRNRKRSPWDSSYEWKPFLDRDYSSLFDNNCIKYAHYVDAVMGTKDFIFNDVAGKDQVPKCEGYFTALEEDVFPP